MQAKLAQQTTGATSPVRNRISSHQRKFAAIVAVGCVGALLAACSSSSGSSATGSTKSNSVGSASPASGATVNIMGIGTFTSPIVSTADAATAMQAEVAKVNAAGGANGHKINLTICNDQFDPNKAATCARQAVSDHDVAVISSFEINTPQVVPILEQAGIPYINATPVAPIDNTSSIEFPLTSGSPAQFGSLGVALHSAGCSHLGVVVTGTASTELGEQWLAKGMQSVGGTVSTVSVSLTQVSFAPQVAQLESEGVQCIVPATAPSQAPTIVTAVAQSGKNLLIGGITSEFPAQSLSALGAQANGILLTGQEYRPTDTSVPALQAVISAFAQYAPGQTLADPFGVDGWAAASVVTSLIGHAKGAVTASSVLEAAKASTATDTSSVMSPFGFASVAPVASLPRLKNWGYLTWKVAGGSAQLVGTGFTQLTGIS
jgi:branched-chain amino acid transport system substrate-binding protein